MCNTVHIRAIPFEILRRRNGKICQPPPTYFFHCAPLTLSEETSELLRLQPSEPIASESAGSQME